MVAGISAGVIALVVVEPAGISTIINRNSTESRLIDYLTADTVWV